MGSQGHYTLHNVEDGTILPEQLVPLFVELRWRRAESYWRCSRRPNILPQAIRPLRARALAGAYSATLEPYHGPVRADSWRPSGRIGSGLARTHLSPHHNTPDELVSAQSSRMDTGTSGEDEVLGVKRQGWSGTCTRHVANQLESPSMLEVYKMVGGTDADSWCDNLAPCRAAL